MRRRPRGGLRAAHTSPGRYLQCRPARIRDEREHRKCPPPSPALRFPRALLFLLRETCPCRLPRCRARVRVSEAAAAAGSDCLDLPAISAPDTALTAGVQ